MKAILFDRDGTLNIDPGYINNPDNMNLYPGTLDILNQIKLSGYKIFVISNQSGIGRGKIQPREYRNVSRRFLSLSGGYEIIEDILYCPHTPENDCSCRKPMAALINIIIDQYEIDLKKSYFVGDKMSDIAVGEISGLKTVLILNDNKRNTIPLSDEYPDIKADIIINEIADLPEILT